MFMYNAKQKIGYCSKKYKKITIEVEQSQKLKNQRKQEIT